MLSRDDEVLLCFLEESREQLAGLEDDLLELQQQGDDIDYELVNCIFRAIHAVKGGSFFFGLDKLGDLAHHLEVVIDRIHRQELTLNADITGVLLSGVAMLNTMVNNRDQMDTVEISEIDRNIETLLLLTLTEEEKKVSNTFVNIKFFDGKPIFSVNKYDFQRAAADVKGGGNIYLLKYDLIKDIEEKDRTPWEVISELLQVCVFIDSKVDIDAIGTLDSAIPESIPFFVLISTVIDENLLCDFIGIDRANIYHVGRDGIVESMNNIAVPDITESILDYIVPAAGMEETATAVQVLPDDQGTVRLERAVFELIKERVGSLLIARKQLEESCRYIRKEVFELLDLPLLELAKILGLSVDNCADCQRRKKPVVQAANSGSSQDKLSVIIFKSGDEYLAVPLGLISKIERIGAKDILIDDCRNYIEYRGGELELHRVADVLGFGDLAESEEYIVSLFCVGDKEIGFIFNSIFSILNYKGDINPCTDEAIGAAGTLQLNHLQVTLLNLHEIFFMQYPQLNTLHADSINIPGVMEGVLLIDDSEFFLNYIKHILQHYGFVVYIAKNNQEVVEALDEYGGDIGMVLFDIDFSSSTIIEFIAQIKGINRFADLEVIALTAQAGEEKRVMRMQNSSFIGGYLMKMDFYHMIEKCTEILRRRGDDVR